MKRIALFTIAIVAMTLSAMAATSEGTNNFTIKRGTNVSHWLSQSNERGVARRLHIQEGISTDSIVHGRQQQVRS